MNRWLTICAFWLCQLMLFAQGGVGVSEGDINPDPSYTLTLQVTPERARDYVPEVMKYTVGTNVYLYVYQRQGYVFERWSENGETVSTDQYCYYKMPDRDVTLTAEFRYDPATPANPQVPKLKHTLTLNAIPVQAGSFNWGSYSEHLEDDYVEVYAYNRGGYRFKEWQQEGQTVSTDYWYMFEMPHNNLTLTAIYEYSPALPSNPGSNYFNPATGEVIINDFLEGELNNALWNLAGGEIDAVKMVTVIGKTNGGDWGIARELSQCTMLDLSRTTGMQGVPGWAFQGSSSLSSIELPASISYIGEYAFYECSSMQQLIMHAVTPPELGWNALDGLSTENVVIYVPAASVGLYNEAEGWKNYTIMPLQDQVSKLEVNLPEGTDLSLYKDMYIELMNIQSGQKQRYLITNRMTYTFSSLIHNTQYNVYLKNSQDVVLGQILDVQVVKDDVSVTFEELIKPVNVGLTVTIPNGTDVTDQVTVTWMDANGGFIARGSQLTNLLPGKQLRYRISLSQTLALQYQIPAEADYEVMAEDNAINSMLIAIPRTTMSGSVKDVKTGAVLSGATISVSQMLNGLYSKAFTTKTDAQGNWTMQVFVAKTDITASMANYVSKSLTLDMPEATVPAFELKDINGTTIILNLTYTDVAGNTTAYADYENVTYTITDQQTGGRITEMNVQYPNIVLMEQHAQGTQFSITAISKTQKFMPVTALAVVDNVDCANVTLALKQLGGINASYAGTDNLQVVGILYDQNGKLVNKYEYTNATLNINELNDGQYTLVTMGLSQYFNTIYSIANFAESGLREGIDYVKNRVTVKSGAISKVTNQLIPYLDETKLYYTNSNASFTVNKSQVNAGQYLTLNCHLGFKSMYVGQVSNVKLIVELPETTGFVDNSVMLGNATASYTYANNTVIIPMENYTERIRFCIIPTAGGTYSPAASVQFTYGDKTIIQPIGNATYTVKDLTLNVPAVVASNKVPVSGSAVGKSTVKVYADGMLLGQTVALANGLWATTIELDNPENYSTHSVYAIVTTTTGLEMQSETQTVLYDNTALQVSSVIMYYTNPEENWWRGKNYELVFDFLAPSVTPYRYVYYIYNRSFTFAINFNSDDPDKLEKVILEVKTGTNRWVPVVAKFDTRKGTWLAYGEFGNMYDGVVPYNFRVRFVRKGGGTGTVDLGEVLVEYPGPDMDVPIDPSGYVYEAVPSNRVQGATASIYYKETVEDQYGDKHEKIVLWDAEEYAQENPLFTDENGMYRWDVPQGLWQVKIEKEGYQTAYSEWLPVPPPQLDVNIALTQLLQPNVQTASAFEDGVDIEFNKFMDSAMLTAENITLTRNGEPVEGTILLLNEQKANENENQTYASKLRFSMPENETLLSTDDVVLTIKRKVKSYAGVPMEQDYMQDFTVEPKIRSISGVDSLINLGYGAERTLLVGALPSDASKGKKMMVRTLSTTIASINSQELMLDENGQAELKVTGEMPGTTVLTFAIEGSDVEERMTVNVKEPERMTTLAPIASRVTGTQVYRDTKILLTSETENAAIYYTLDGSNPADTAKAILYNANQPIVIAQDTVNIKAIAFGHDLEPSDVADFKYMLKKAEVGYMLTDGWTWISHNLESDVLVSEFLSDAERILGQTSEVINDPKAGMIGNLEGLRPTEAYKVKLTTQAAARIKGYEFNAASTPVPVESGWNWLGYPVNQPMTVAEALYFFNATEGDYIVGQDGFAQFTNGEWKGTLEGLTPGKGYMFKSAVKDEIVFNTTVVSVAASRMNKRDVLMNCPWKPAKYAHPNIMPMTAQLYENGVKVDGDEYIVGAFADAECRGVGIWQDNRLLMSIYGENQEDVRFLAMQTATGRCFNLTEIVPFVSDNMGSWNAPIKLTIDSEMTAVEQVTSALSVTPSVARDQITVIAGGQHINSLTLCNMGGQTVLSATDLGTVATVNISKLPEGMYVVTVKTDGLSLNKKILKTNN